VPLLNSVVVDVVLAFAGTVTMGSVTTGAAVTIAGGGAVVSTSRVVVVSMVCSVEQPDIQPSAKHAQTASVTLVLIFNV
jgi:hypothetical protein